MNDKDVAIDVRDLAKRYRIGRLVGRSNGQRSLLRKLTSTFNYLASTLREPSPDEIIWALNGVSFEVNRGEVVGIIGENGAGKSTLLKLLSRITEPTRGEAIISGRVGSLLEVGTGFHPELTGRENVYLSGAILGMKRFEIDRKFDEIVDFSGVEKFIDTPVKRYSSGMKVRLGFAVAAHLDPEILLIDEVLAVGDAAFQKKCLARMGEVGKVGRTVLFVSHNMTAIQSLCERAIWLKDGNILVDGHPDQVVTRYLQDSLATSMQTEMVWNDLSVAPGNDQVRLHRFCVRPEHGSPEDRITMRTPTLLEFEFWNLVPDAYLDLNFHLMTEENVVAFASSTLKEPAWHGRPFPTGLFRSTCRVPGDLLNTGQHRVRLRVVESGRIIYDHADALTFEVQDSMERRGSWFGKRAGAVRPLLAWDTELVAQAAEVADADVVSQTEIYRR